eukprot:275991-Amphidinium_carterae.1
MKRATVKILASALYMCTILGETNINIMLIPKYIRLVDSTATQRLSGQRHAKCISHFGPAHVNWHHLCCKGARSLEQWMQLCRRRFRVFKHCARSRAERRMHKNRQHFFANPKKGGT